MQFELATAKPYGPNGLTASSGPTAGIAVGPLQTTCSGQVFFYRTTRNRALFEAERLPAASVALARMR